MGEEEKIKELKELMVKQANIRNVCTSAHIHHGKCISGGSRVFVADIGLKSAKDIFEEVAESGEVYEDNEDHTIFVPKKEVLIYSLNKETNKIEKRPVKYVWRLKGGNTLKVKLRNGFEVNTTPEHKYLIFDNWFSYKEAKDLKIGDRVVCARRIDVNKESDIKAEFLKKLSQKNFYVKLTEDFSKLLKKKILDYGIKNIKTSIKTKSFYHGLWQNRYNLTDLIMLCNLFNIDLTEVYGNIDRIYYRTGKQRGGNSNPMHLPVNFDELFYLAGLFIGDGSGKKFVVGKEQLAGQVLRICKTLGILAKQVKGKDRTPEIHTNLTLVQMFNALFDYPLKQKSHNVKISDFVWKCNNWLVSNLLRGYFDTDGCVEKSRSAVTISSASNKMIDDLHLLLLRFGCVSIKEKDNTLSLSGLSAINFCKWIGFGLKEKAEKLNILVEKASGSIVCDTIRYRDHVMLINKRLSDFNSEELAYIGVSKIEAGFEEVVYDFTVPETHNFIAEGMVIHNTALTDNLLAASGYMSARAAGSLEEGMATWQHLDEQERLMTVDAADVSMVHEFEGQKFLINLIDTPGHVDFGGNVTRAMRAIDGTICLVCGVEGIMPQTETVVKQALRERVKPVLFINKVDRMINELKLTPEQMQQRLLKLVLEFNQLIERTVEPEFRDKWKVDISDGSVAFGSARENWALSVSFMKKKNITFKDIIDLYLTGKPQEEVKKWTWKNAPLYEVLLDMVIKHLPNPLEAQKYRIPKIWSGDLDSELGKNLLNCDPKGKTAFVITRVVIDQKSGRELAAGRLFSGVLTEGMNVYLNSAKMYQRVAQVFMYKGVKPESVGEVGAGNVLALGGISGYAGETITLEPEQPFEELRHIFEPVITKAIEPAKPQDLPKLVEVLKKVGKEDPSVKIEINEETGENLISGMGELHLEIIENRIITEKGLQIKTSAPMVVYRETVTKVSPEVEGKSPNKHNKFYFTVEPLNDNIYRAIKDGRLIETKAGKKEYPDWKKLVDLGMETKEARKIKDVYNANVLLDNTRGIVHIGEVIDLIIEGFEQVIQAGPLAREPCTKLLVRIHDLKLHEDAIHRGPSQVLPAVRNALREGMLNAGAVMFEPVQVLMIECPENYLGEMSRLVQNKRGQLLDVNSEGGGLVIKAKLPVAEMIGLSSDLRSATEGRGNFFISDQLFEKLPEALKEKTIKNIRSRKGLSAEETSTT